ncbi:hypothetical protein LX81_01185 [Palleronia aestuarii]|uniref:Uncharacterized protein n=1 Tax=Palleronia aestuarii TaxID=568105 RepID=A0A2W7NDR1_9RHOB|nr:hypothetical protein [Palleronia aestuarii]PZX18551.1 hypothetical protein LX81_01185 [Palleronia aestuarii]
MSREAFVALTGRRLVHRTLAANRAGIEAEGLLRAGEIARRAGTDRSIALRAKALTFMLGERSATLNHQLPLRAGRNADFLDGCSIHTWAEQLDERVFLWPARGGAAFGTSLGDRGQAWEIALDAGALYDALADRIDLAPINTGNARRRPTPRGDWIYVLATEARRFRRNRIERGRAAKPDRLVEVSVRGDIPADLLRRIAG